ncbi:MAG: hypothetical protein P9M14_04505 [Candidatus Alcyoniella australis]|nr:hypothetical protein [Candidatus Alcyoniella australis]
MVGVIVIAHGGLAETLINTARMILGQIDSPPVSLDVDGTDPADVIGPRLEETLRRAASPKGVLIMTDMFGGTPANVALSYLDPGKVEVVTGINLPMLLKVIEERGQYPLGELASRVQHAGRENIMLASALLNP